MRVRSRSQVDASVDRSESTSGRFPFIRRTRFGVSTPFTLEAQLVDPVTGWLEDLGYDVSAEVPILGRRADLVGTRDDALVAVELKMSDWREALRQAIAYQLAADRAWIAMPLGRAWPAYRQRWRLEADGIGLLVVDDRGAVRAPVAAGPSPRLLPFLRERVLFRADVALAGFQRGLEGVPSKARALHAQGELGDALEDGQLA